MAAASLLHPSGHTGAALASRMVGQTLNGTYRILDLLDAGAMGAVFLAEHLRLRRRVAVKVLATHLKADSRALARFVREAEVISRLEHPHVVSVTDFDQTEAGEPYLVMELLQGETLEDRLVRVGFMPSAEAVGIALQIAGALSAAHRATIVHRDLKPANVFLANVEDEGAFVKLLDFGISKWSAQDTGVTGQFDIVGTPEYMSPEQASGQTALVDHRGDQYSLAVVTFEMLTGQLPFASESVPVLLNRVVHEPPPSLRQVAPHVPAQLDPVLRRALSKHPNRRYESITAFATDLALAVGQRPSQPYRASRFSLTTASAPSEAPLSDRHSSPTVAGERTSGYRLTNAETTTVNHESVPDSSRSGVRRNGAPGAAAPPRKSFLLEIADARRGLDATVLSRVLVVDEAVIARASMSPQEAFLVSCIMDGATVDDVVDLSPLDREDTLRLLQGLARRGIVLPVQ